MNDRSEYQQVKAEKEREFFKHGADTANLKKCPRHNVNLEDGLCPICGSRNTCNKEDNNEK